MEFRELKVGMVVKANKESNRRYNYTKEELGCVGVVVSVDASYEDFNMKVIKHNSTSEIGQIYKDLDPRYFDMVAEKEEEKGETGMKVVLKSKECLENVKAGDLLVDTNGKMVLLAHDYDGLDFRGVILGETVTTTGYRDTIEEIVEVLQDKYGFEEIARVVKAENLVLSEV